MLAYQKTDWTDRIVQNPRTYTMTENPNGTVTLTPNEGTVTEPGTLVNAARLNNLEAGSEQALYGGLSPISTGVYTEIEYNSDGMPRVVYLYDSTGNKISKTELAFTDGKVTSAEKTTYGSDGVEVTNQYIDALTYLEGWLDFAVGDCENAALWSPSSATLTTDSAIKIQGAASVRVTLTSTVGFGYYDVFSLLDPSKYYFVSAYVRNGTGTSAYFQIYANGTGRVVKSSSATALTSFVNKGVVLLPSDWGTVPTTVWITAVGTGVSSNYINIDAIKIWEISAADSLLSESELLEKYKNLPTVEDGSFIKSERSVII